VHAVLDLPIVAVSVAKARAEDARPAFYIADMYTFATQTP
jgi:hypothetical protein